MENSKRHQPLVVGDIIYLETVNRFNPRGRKCEPFHVVEVNPNSAYCVRHDFVDKYNRTPERRLRTRVDQRTKTVINSNQGFDTVDLVWFSEEEFNSDFNGAYQQASDSR